MLNNTTTQEQEINSTQKGQYVKALQGLKPGEMTLPPVSPEVIHIQSFS